MAFTCMRARLIVWRATRSHDDTDNNRTSRINFWRWSNIAVQSFGCCHISTWSNWMPPARYCSAQSVSDSSCAQYTVTTPAALERYTNCLSPQLLLIFFIICFCKFANGKKTTVNVTFDEMLNRACFSLRCAAFNRLIVFCNKWMLALTIALTSDFMVSH